MTDSTSLAKAHFWVWLSYVLALVAGYGTILLLPQQHVLIQLFVADVVGTVVVFAFSVRFNNSSFYDPYWSVIPVFLGLAFLMLPEAKGDFTRQVVVMGLVTSYGVRLTYNWARGWTGLAHEDWRYVDLRHKHGAWYWPVSFLGIHLMPTVLVFLGCLPLWYALALNTAPFGWPDVVATGMAALAIVIEGTADNQLRRFRKSNPPKGSIMDKGLWAYSRHPNYFGEILFWWGLAAFVLLSSSEYAWLSVGALSITVLFNFISIPMIDRRMLARRPGYAAHRERVSRLVPWPKKTAKVGPPRSTVDEG